MLLWPLSEKARVLFCQTVEAHIEPAVKMKLLSLAAMLCPQFLSALSSFGHHIK